MAIIIWEKSYLSQKIILTLQIKSISMKNFLSSVFSLLMAIVLLSSCQGNYRTGNASADSVAVAGITSASVDIVDKFFTEFQQANDGWTKTKEGQNKLVKAFEEKMISDVDFAKAVASYNTEFEYDNSIRQDDSISPYGKGDGEEGEIKAFEFVIPVKLVKPLYNGQKKIEVSYEIISAIPSTIEEHWRPYTANVNHCATFDPYFNSQRNGVLNLGSFVVIKKD